MPSRPFLGWVAYPGCPWVPAPAMPGGRRTSRGRPSLFLDSAERLRLYGHQAKNKSLEAGAFEIRMRAERRLGEIMAQQAATVGLATGSRGQLDGRNASGGFLINPPENDQFSLSRAGIDKNLAPRARPSLGTVRAPGLLSNARHGRRLTQEPQRADDCSEVILLIATEPTELHKRLDCVARHFNEKPRHRVRELIFEGPYIG